MPYSKWRRRYYNEPMEQWSIVRKEIIQGTSDFREEILQLIFHNKLIENLWFNEWINDTCTIITRS